MDPPTPETWPGPIRIPVLRQSAPGPEFFRSETGPRIRHVPPTGEQIAKITRRIGRATAGFSRKVSVIRDQGNCVVGLVGLEPPTDRLWGGPPDLIFRLDFLGQEECACGTGMTVETSAPVSPAVFRASGSGSASLVQQWRSIWKWHPHRPINLFHLRREQAEVPPRRLNQRYLKKSPL